MEHSGIHLVRDPEPGATGDPEDGLNLGAWFQRGWTTATNLGEKSADFVGGLIDRFREADALAYDNDGEGDQNDN